MIPPGPLLPLFIELAGVPRGKGAARITNAGGRPRSYENESTRNYLTQVRRAGADAMEGAAPLDGPIEVWIEARMQVAGSLSKKNRARALAGQLRPTVKPDWDNFGKVCDALNGIVWVDDKQIVEGHVRKVYSDRPGLRIEVRRPSGTGET
jgi:Holliday junction resolvase RusA-like endonuclease